MIYIEVSKVTTLIMSQLQKIGRSTFCIFFSECIAKENLSKYLSMILILLTFSSAYGQGNQFIHKDSTVEKSNYVDSLNIYNSTTIRLICTIPVDKVDHLFIVDGKEVERSYLNSINPKNVKSIKVLRDQKTLSLYGEKGENGVVIIETRKVKYSRRSSKSN